MLSFYTYWEIQQEKSGCHTFAQKTRDLYKKKRLVQKEEIGTK